eukprot:Skav229180  [mRNA]  locus=scaffold1004:222636:229187:- [translate_table: standard]
MASPHHGKAAFDAPKVTRQSSFSPAQRVLHRAVSAPPAHGAVQLGTPHGTPKVAYRAVRAASPRLGSPRPAHPQPVQATPRSPAGLPTGRPPNPPNPNPNPVVWRPPAAAAANQSPLKRASSPRNVFGMESPGRKAQTPSPSPMQRYRDAWLTRWSHDSNRDERLKRLEIETREARQRLQQRLQALEQQQDTPGIVRLSLDGSLDRSSNDYFDDIYPVPLQNRDVLQQFLNETSTNQEIHFQLVRAVRVEHSRLWSQYQSLAGEVGRRKQSFKGHGAPTTNQALASVESWGGWYGGFVHALNENICEAYLFHGTEPHTALKIVEGGFAVKHASRAGKRFGIGGYFSEDPAVADKYAGEGEGLYQGCYAMLLCRVILGSQYCTKMFRKEDAAAEAARSGCDSILAEPHGTLHREFVVLDGSQIYPEYALVYERQGADFGMCPSPVNRYWAGEGAVDVGFLPPYWFHAGQQATIFHETHPDQQMKVVMNELLSKTWLSDVVFTQSSPLSPPSPLRSRSYRSPYVDITVALRCLKVVRVEDSEMWTQYRAAQRAVAGRAARGDLERIEVHTVEALPQREHRRLKEELNEVYLFYGTSPQNVMYIAQHGFPVTTSGDMFGFDFGEGAYLHEDASEADKRSSDDKNGYYKGYFAMLLCRVTLGAVQVLHGPDANAHVMVGPDKDYDSTVGSYGDHSSVGMIRREFVVTERSLIYPEYAIIYERVTESKRKSKCGEQRVLLSDRMEGERILLLS